jgi:hypothetical protein
VLVVRARKQRSTGEARAERIFQRRCGVPVLTRCVQSLRVSRATETPGGWRAPSTEHELNDGCSLISEGRVAGMNRQANYLANGRGAEQERVDVQVTRLAGATARMIIAFQQGWSPTRSVSDGR